MGQFWERLERGDDLLQALPGSAGSKDCVGRKGVVRDEGVDLELFGLSRAAAQKMGTEQRVLLGLAHEVRAV